MTKPYCIQQQIKWKFIPQLAPWHGGFYERLVALVKHCLKRTLEKHLLDDRKLVTVIKEVESVINSRPLTQVGTEIDHVLRPADFLTLGKCLTTDSSSVELPSTGTTQKIELVNSWKKGLKIRDEFKKMFIGQYLTSLRERHQHLPKQPRIQSHLKPKLGDIVQIKTDAKNRENWKIGKIVDLIKGTDGECRVARVEVEDSSTLTRSIGHLYPLEADLESQQCVGPVAELESDQIITPSVETNIQMDEAQSEGTGLESPVDNLPSPMEVDPCLEEVESAQEHVEELTLHPEVKAPGLPEVTPEAELAQQGEGDTRSKRGAAIRARKKILEWTRHLLVLLQ